MRPCDDSSDEMLGNWLDQDTTDRLLTGGVAPDDAPPGFADVARAIGSLTGPARGDELARERQAVAAAVRVLADDAPGHAVPRRSKMRSKLARTKIAGLVVVGTIVGTTGLAAANVLPDPAQAAFSHALSRVGIDVPDPGDHPAATGQEISQLATTTDATGVDKGALISSTASGGMSRAGQQGGAGTGADHAAVSVPNPGGTGTADGASGSEDQSGSTTADGASGGRSADGSANATPAPAP